ncbi:hypothetical protein SAMN05216551_109177 [Chitinasiproducens palmae]|uniref:Uncharacterized protein n=1 Tax=Chitinasiproducens palmae TaxID=1770053 RepID=A0A1H2PSA7_9BURK|nr:hypothetical protein SAMN05216551_109177 [Chitinasiproducens palmae]
MDWVEIGKGVGTAIGGALGALGTARLWRQIDRVKQAQADADSQSIRADARAGLDVIARYQALAERSEERASRAESRELLAVQRADRAEERERAAVERADAADSRARIAENKVRELETRIEKLEAIIGGRRRSDA